MAKFTRWPCFLYSSAACFTVRAHVFGARCFGCLGRHPTVHDTPVFGKCTRGRGELPAAGEDAALFPPFLGEAARFEPLRFAAGMTDGGSQRCQTEAIDDERSRNLFFLGLVEKRL